MSAVPPHDPESGLAADRAAEGAAPATSAAPDLAPSKVAQLHIDRDPAVKSGAPASKRLPWTAMVLGVVAVACVVGWWAWPRSASVQITSVVSTTASQQYVVLTASGYVVAQRRAAVASKATGRLVDLLVTEGSHVRAGDLIARLDDSDVQAARLAAEAGSRQAEAGVRQAEVEQTNAQAELKRDEGLVAQGFISAQALDTAQTRARSTLASVAAAKASLQAANAQIQVQEVARQYTEIRAPFDGVVLVKNANIGDIITPLSSAAGTQGAVVTMADMGSLEVEADVSEGSLAKATVGQPVEINLDALPGQRFLGHVAGLVPTVDRAKATVTTKIRFDHLDVRILPEMSAKVSFLSHEVTPADERPLIAVAAKAIRTWQGQDVVWLLRSGTGEAADSASSPETSAWHVHAVPIKRGRMLGDVQEIAAITPSDLHPNDKVVLDTLSDLREGGSASIAE